MSGVEGFLIVAGSGIFINLLTKGIDPVLKVVRAAQRCQEECGKLADSVVKIRGDVQHIVGQFQELERYDPVARYDLRVVANSVYDLMTELELAGLDVYECDSASTFGKKLGSLAGHCNLSKRITKRNERITGLAQGVLVQANFSLTAMVNLARRSFFDAHQYGQVNPIWQQHYQMVVHQSPLVLQKWRHDVDIILQREDSTRHSQRLQSEYSLHSASSSHGP